MEKDILHIVLYFAQFDYPPNFDEIYTFFPKKINPEILKKELDRLCKVNKLIKHTPPQYISNSTIYTLPQYSIYIKNRLNRQHISQNKLHKAKFYINLLSKVPFIKLIGITGSVSMFNAKDNDDIDLFIITSENRVWTGRITAIILAEMLRIRRRRTDWKNLKNKICLNLFFDQKNLHIMKFKQTEYIAHEVLQLKPIINKDATYQKFLEANEWVFDFFPNAKDIYHYKQNTSANSKIMFTNNQFQKITNTIPLPHYKIIKIKNYFMQIIETLCKHFQYKKIKQNIKGELVTESQMWFFS
jgi:hypothetical protein